MSRVIQPPDWGQTPGRPRVLVEACEWDLREHLRKRLTDHGYAVISCDGPEGSDDQCALVANGRCHAAKGADVIVHLLRHSDPRNRNVLVRLQRAYPGTPVVVDTPAPRVEAWPEDFAGATVIEHPMQIGPLLEALDRLLSDGAQDRLGRPGSAP